MPLFVPPIPGPPGADGADGGGGGGPALPRAETAFYSVPIDSGQTTLTMPNDGFVYSCVIEIPAPMTILSVLCSVVSANNNGVRLGLYTYEPVAGAVSTLLADAGQLNGGTLGVKDGDLGGASFDFEAAGFIVAVVVNQSTTTLGVVGQRDTRFSGNATAADAITSTGTGGYCRSTAGELGGLPGTLSVNAETSALMPRMAIKGTLL